MLNTLRRWLVVGSLLSGLAGVPAAQAAEVIKISMLAPAASPWGQVFKIWGDAVAKESNGQLALQFFWDGQQGDEGAMVGKLKSGDLDGAALTSVGLGKLYPQVLALELPGIFSTWAGLDRFRNDSTALFLKGIQDNGMTLVGWSDVGAVHALSKGYGVTSPESLRGHRPFVWADDPTGLALYHAIGGVTPVPLTIPEVLAQLTTGSIDAVFSSSLAAEQLQWTSKLDTVVDRVSGFSVGGLVISTKRLGSLSDTQRTLLLNTGKITANALTRRIRAEDAAAYARIKGKMKVMAPTPTALAQWAAVYREMRKKLVPSVFSADLMAKLEAASR